MRDAEGMGRRAVTLRMRVGKACGPHLRGGFKQFGGAGTSSYYGVPSAFVLFRLGDADHGLAVRIKSYPVHRQ